MATRVDTTALLSEHGPALASAYNEGGDCLAATHGNGALTLWLRQEDGSWCCTDSIAAHSGAACQVPINNSITYSMALKCT